MANRYPLIFDTSDNKLKEIPSGDNLNLSGSGIVDVSSITCTGTITGNVRFSVYNNAVISSNLILYSSDMNKVLLIDTSSTRIISLPSGASVTIGDWIRIVDIGTGQANAGNAFKNNITITPNAADRIQGGAAGDTFIMDVDSQAVTMMWCGSTYDWRLVS